MDRWNVLSHYDGLEHIAVIIKCEKGIQSLGSFWLFVQHCISFIDFNAQCLIVSDE